MRTTVEGMPSTRINRLSFFTASSTSAADLGLCDERGRLSILLKEWAVAAAAAEGDILSLLG